VVGGTLSEDGEMDAGKYPAYARLYSVYFHQDWQLDDPNPEDVVRAFFRYEPQELHDGLRAELKGLLRSGQSDDDLEAVLAPWNTFRPKDVEITIREWLRRLLVLLDEADS
jgi:CdiI immunity protein